MSGNVKRTAVIGAAIAGLAIGALLTWAIGLAGGAPVRVVEGYAAVNAEGTAIGLSPDGETAGTGYAISGAMWRDQGGPWHDAPPTCLAPSATGTRVRLGIVNARAKGDAPGRPVVVWLECLAEGE